MTTKQIADSLVNLCREGKFEEAQKNLYAANAVSIETVAMPGMEKETKGLPAIVQKGKNFVAMIETMHSMSVSDPVVAGASFACTMQIDAKMKGQPRANRTELCVYLVKDGKITVEQFFE